MKKLILLLPLLILFVTIMAKNAFAITCNSISGRVVNVEGQGISDARIIFYENNSQLFQPAGTRSDGSFDYGFPVSGNVRIDIIKNGYQTSSQLLGACNPTLTLQQTGLPTEPPGNPNAPACGSGCTDPEQCYGASGGCTTCYQRICVNPRDVPSSTAPTTKPGCGPTQSGVDTALGCIETRDPNFLTSSILRLGIGIGGGIAFLLMIIGTFMIITSSGDPDRLKAGKEMITSAVAGLLLIIFSVFLLQLIGVDLLKIPGFTTTSAPVE